MSYYLAYMKVITTSALRKNLARYLDEVALKGERIVVARNSDEGDGLGVMIVPLATIEDGEDLEGASELDETEYLLSNPANAARLRESIAQDRAGFRVIPDQGIFDEEPSSQSA